MPRFEPFRGLRYDPGQIRLADVVAPPYDVIAPEEQRDLRARSPYNSVRIELPDGESSVDPYQAAAKRVADWQAGGILRRDEHPSLYGYRMTYTDAAGRRGQTIGVIGALGLEPPGAGIFLHEQTTPKARSDRLQLLEATGLNTSPIWALSLGKGLSDELAATGDVVAVVDTEGAGHELWPITDSATIARVSEAVSAAPVVLADGHHRYETALAYQRRRRSGRPSGAGARGYDSVMALVVELAEEQLSVQGIHRLISGLPGGFDLVGALAGYFDLVPTDAPDAGILDRMGRGEAPALVTAQGAWLLHPKPETAAQARQDLDSSRLEVALAALPGHELVYQHGWDLAVGAVARGEAQAAVLLRPVTVDQIAATGQGGERMPPKTTFFWPKPRTGFVFREVAD